MRGSIEWAAVPASRALAASVVNRRAVCCTDGVPTSAKRASASGSRGRLRIGRQDVGHDAVQPVHQRPDQVPVGRAVAAQTGGRLADVPVERGSPRAAERVGERHLGLPQHDPEAGQVERAEER